MNQTLLYSKLSSLLLLVVISFTPILFPNTVNASHIMGGEITAQHISGLDYELRLVLYRDVQGINLSQNVTLVVENLSNSTTTTVAAGLDSSVFDTMGISMGVVIGVEGMYYKSSAITLLANTAYRISWETCCRNGAILNCLSPGSQSMHLTTLLTTIPSFLTVNSTPYYLAAPVAYLPVDTPWQHNPMPFDVDGDSLVWSVDTPWTTANVNVPAWTSPSAHPTGPFTINPNNGQIDWEPNTLGSFIASMLVEEFRAGVKIGEIRRDMQFVVVPDSSFISPRIGNFNIFPLDPNGNAKINVQSGSMYTVTLLASDPQNDDIEFLSYGEPYMFASNPANFTSTSTVPGQASGTFSWTPNLSQARVNPYIISFRTSDGFVAFDETLLIEVGNFTSTQNVNTNSLGNFYPNPAQNILFVPFHMENTGKLTFEVFDILGSEVVREKTNTYESGSHTEKFSVDLPSGIYFLKISNEGNEIGTRKFVVNK